MRHSFGRSFQCPGEIKGDDCLALDEKFFNDIHSTLSRHVYTYRYRYRRRAPHDPAIGARYRPVGFYSWGEHRRRAGASKCGQLHPRRRLRLDHRLDLRALHVLVQWHHGELGRAPGGASAIPAHVDVHVDHFLRRHPGPRLRRRIWVVR